VKQFRFIILISLVLSGSLLKAQEGSVLRGSVRDPETGEMIVGVNVIEYDSDKRIITGTITDPNGNYVLNVTNPDAIIAFSFIGYELQEIPLGGRTNLNIELVPESYKLEEITVTAEANTDPLSNVSRRDMAGSRVKIDMAEFKDFTAISVEEALQGKVSGLDIMALSGDPGSGSSIVIRGLGSLGNARPLIVVDGIPQSATVSRNQDLGSMDQEDIGALVNLPPQDIKSIEVLKDAVSTAVWGTKGADGVLLIETKRGKMGKTIFEYQGKYTYTVQPPTVPMLNGDEYIMLQLEQWHNADGIYPVPDEIAYDPDFIDFYNYSANTDWIGAVTRNGFVNDQYFSVSGGGEKTRYLTSLNLLDNQGTTINQSFKRVSTRVNLDYNVSRKLRFSVNFNYSNNFKEGNYIFNRWSRNPRNIRQMAYLKAPNMSIWEINERGERTGEYFNPVKSYQGLGTYYFNPVAVGNLSRSDQQGNRVPISFTLNYNIVPWVNFLQLVSMEYYSLKEDEFLPYNAVGADWLDPSNNLQTENNSSATRIITRSQLRFTPRLNEIHSLSGMLMFEADQDKGEWSKLVGRNGPSTSIQDPASNVPITSLWSNTWQTHVLGTLANLNYKFKDRYITQLNLRADASSRFGSNHRWGIFPSAAFAWRFSEEPWLSGLTFLTESKLRFSWGQSGRQPSGGSYARYGTFDTPSVGQPSQYIEGAIVIPKGIQLTNLKWQTVTQNNLGLDLSLFNRINITGELYTKLTTDLLWGNYQIPSSSGFGSLNQYNGGKLRNEGWELSVGALVLRRQTTTLRLNFNLSQNTNSFEEFPENFNNEVDLSIGNGKYPRKAQLGQPIGSFYGFRYRGVWASDDKVVAYNEDGDILRDVSGVPIPLTYRGIYPFKGGDAIYDDVNHDGQIDLQDVVYLGNSNPKIIGGFGGNFTWKDFRIATQWHYRLGFVIVNENALRTEGMLGKNNQSKATLHRWRTQGQDEPGMLPRAYMNHPYNNLGSDRYVEKGDYLRLVNLTFSYSIPQNIIRKIRLRSLDVSFIMRRTITLTRYTGQDPEISPVIRDPFWFGTDRAQTPPPKEYALSIAIGF